jgi:hypothetical protein
VLGTPPAGEHLPDIRVGTYTFRVMIADRESKKRYNRLVN